MSQTKGWSLPWSSESEYRIRIPQQNIRMKIWQPLDILKDRGCDTSSCFTPTFICNCKLQLFRESNFSSKHVAGGISCFSMFPVILSQLLGYKSTLFLEFTAPPELQWFWAASTCVPSKAPAFPLKSDFAFRSDSCNSRHWYFREWFGYLPWEILVQLLTRKVKHYFHSFSKLTCRTKDQAENIRKRMGKKSLPGK